MTNCLDRFDHGFMVVIHTPELDGVTSLVGIKKRIRCLQPRRDRVADNAQIDDTSLANLTIQRNMGMSDQNQIDLPRWQPSLQLRITVRGLHARSVVSAWRRVK